MILPVRFLFLLGFLLLSPMDRADAQTAAPDRQIVERWLASNTDVRSLKIDFTQTRTMRSLKVPIRQSGTLWLDYRSDQFRWQTGDPAHTIVVSLGKKILIVRTPMKKFEVRAAGSGDGAPGMAALANGFPRSMREFDAKYRILEIRKQNNTQRIVARPLGSGGRGVSSFTFVVDASQFRLLGIEIDLEDGSSVNTVFTRVETNVAIPANLFKPPLDGYTETKF
jgi:outer membrane lipoprotein-sorting protein